MNKQNKNSKNNTSTKRRLTILLGGIALCLVAGIILWNVKAGNQANDSDQTSASANKSVKVENGEVKIPLSDLSSKAKFYDVELNGTKLELLAVKASDGSIHTAFNTCQVCYSSGRGYYVQEGDELVCQNCGNRFPISEVGVTRNGCNPVPILENERSIGKDSITISASFFEKYVTIFKNWKAS
jgi:uncharacterized membrane protein